MENVTNKLSAEYRPVSVLVCYKNSIYSGFYIESHRVNSKGEVLAGKPLKHETMDYILESFQKSVKEEKKIIGGIIPEGLLLANQATDHYVWVMKPGKKQLYFQSHLNIPDGVAYVPGLVFSAKGRSLKVLAFKTYEGEKTKLYRGPFHNVSSSGGVCLGSAKAELKGHTYQDMINYWEAIFFASEFTHITGEESPVKGNINTMWKQLIETGSEFDYDQLIETPTTIEELLK